MLQMYILLRNGLVHIGEFAYALIYAVLASGNNSKKVKENKENEKNI